MNQRIIFYNFQNATPNGEGSTALPVTFGLVERGFPVTFGLDCKGDPLEEAKYFVAHKGSPLLNEV